MVCISYLTRSANVWFNEVVHESERRLSDEEIEVNVSAVCCTDER